MIVERAFAKANLVLRVGPPRADGLHPICSLFASLDLADEVIVEPSAHDEVVCAGVEGDNLAAAAIDAFRAAAPQAELPPLRVEIRKRIPVAAGLGGGSADAAAVLRAANEIAGAPMTATELRGLAVGLGSDVPSQVEPRHALVTGVGEVVEAVHLPEMTLVLVPRSEGLSTAAVYSELDRLGGHSVDLDPVPLRELAAGRLEDLAGALENDLEAAALSLRPELAESIERLVDAGAMAARVTGSGPTTFGVFAERAAAERAAARLGEEAIVAEVRR